MEKEHPNPHYFICIHVCASADLCKWGAHVISNKYSNWPMKNTQLSMSSDKNSRTTLIHKHRTGIYIYNIMKTNDNKQVTTC